MSLLPFHTAQVVFVVVNNALYLLGIGLTLYALRAGPLEVFLGVLLNTVLFFYAVRQTFGLGQMNGLVVCLLAVALMLALQQRDGWSGAVIAGAAVLKISPILLLGFFIARQRWRAVWGALAAGGVLFAVMLIGAGGDTLAHFVTQVLPAVGRGSAAFPNQSLLGALYRWVAPAADMLSAEGAGDYPLVRGVWLLLSIGVGVITLWFVARAQTHRPRAKRGGFQHLYRRRVVDWRFVVGPLPAVAVGSDLRVDCRLVPRSLAQAHRFLGGLSDRTDAAEHTGAGSSAALPVDWTARLGAHDMGPGSHVGHDVVAFTEPAQGAD